MRFLPYSPAVVLITFAAHAETPDFSSHWHDGKAELNGYKLTVSRYGQNRDGHAVLIYVTEPFSESKRVKVDDPSKNPSDAVDVLKLNAVRDFQTGIYDYNTMVSVFARSSDFSPLKVSFSSAEWCGHVYEELLFHSKKITGHYYSYFEGESGPRSLENKPDGILEDNLLLVLRGLRGAFMEQGQSRTVSFLPSAYHGRLSHEPPAWTTATIARSARTSLVEVPSGEFETIVYTLNIADGRTGKFYVEQAYPHRVVRWELFPDVAAEMTGSTRTKYWQLHDNGEEERLKKLGISPLVP